MRRSNWPSNNGLSLYFCFMPQRIIPTALCSFGMSGQIFHAPFIQAHPGFNFYGVWERSKNLAAATYPGLTTFRSLEAMLEDETVELVVVNTPNHAHYDHARLALLAGKHVIVEKPFTVSSAEAGELTQLAESRGLMLSAYHNRRYDSDFRTLKKLIDEGWLGDMVEAEFHYDRFRPEPGPKLHKENPGPGAGALYDLGAHLIDQALQLFGTPQSLFADLAAMRPGSKVDDYFELLLYYSNFRVRLKCSYLVREALPASILHGSRGSFIKAKSDPQEAMLQAGHRPGAAGWGEEPESAWGLLHTEKNNEIIRKHIPSMPGNYGDYYEGIYQSLVQGTPPPVSSKEAGLVVRLIELAVESGRLGCRVEV